MVRAKAGLVSARNSPTQSLSSGGGRSISPGAVSPTSWSCLAYLKSRDQTLCTTGGSIEQAIKRGNVEFRTLRAHSDDRDGVC